MARDYTKIKAWQLADGLALMVYKATADFPKSELWGLVSQMRRAAVSVPANIVEGSARKGEKEYLQFLYVARASLTELGYYIKFSKQLGYLKADEYERLWNLSEETSKTLFGLISYLENNGTGK